MSGNDTSQGQPTKKRPLIQLPSLREVTVLPFNGTSFAQKGVWTVFEIALNVGAKLRTGQSSHKPLSTLKQPSYSWWQLPEVRCRYAL